MPTDVFFSNRMKIAVIGWGSLIWSPGNLSINGSWSKDGPELPVEFCRISKDKRVTLVIDKEYGFSCKSYWAHLDISYLDQARENLKQRESTSLENIHYYVKDGSTIFPVSEEIKNWMLSTDLDAVVWTGLKSNWLEKRAVPFCTDDLRKYLSETLVGNSAREITDYFNNAPGSIQTPGRKCFEDFIKSIKV